MRIVHPSEIRSMRLKVDLTQSELADKAGVTQAYIAKIETGKADPKISTLEKISKALKKFNSEEESTAEKVMEKPIISAKPEDKIKKVIRLMESNDISQMPIIKNGKQVGSLSEDMIVREISKGKNMFKLIDEEVRNLMGDPFPSVRTETELETISHLLEHSPAVLVLREAEPVGIITKADILQLSMS